MTLSPVVLKSGSAVLSLALFGSVTMTSASSSTPTTAPAPAVSSSTWLVAHDKVLCRMWTSRSRFARRCTTEWTRDRFGNIITTDPYVAGVAASDLADLPVPQDREHAEFLRQQAAWTAAHPPAPPRVVIARPMVSTVARPVASVPVSYNPSGGYGLWTPPPGLPAYYLSDYAGDPYSGFWGYCTWYAQYKRMDEHLMVLGNAGQWAYTAAAHGLRTGTVPVAGATAVYQGGLGHVAHVEKVLGGGWFLVSEMNMYWNGGGFGRVSWRYSFAGPGVTFVY
ncbi:MAG TPA: CHAP domain-containing protein [Ktedonobacterales bacterium]